MITRRNFITITLMMAILLFLFVSTEAIKDNWNEYEKNEALAERLLLESTQWKPDGDTQVLYLGDTDSGIYTMLTQWCTYRKWSLDLWGEEQEFQPGENLRLLVVDGKNLDVASYMNQFWELTNLGIPIVFARIPSYETLLENQEMKDMLGIQNCISPQQELGGVRLFSGFLLGGESIYVQDEENSNRQDLVLQVPWYRIGNGTKSYMVGQLEEQGETKNEMLPAIIWRHSVGNTQVFAVNGDYLSGTQGIGFLSAMMSEVYPYDLYPIVNAQNITILDYPSLAMENGEAMQSLYSRGQREVGRDLVWMGIAMVAETTGNRLTCLTMPEYDYQDENTPSKADLVYYLKLLKERKGELGVSLTHTDTLSLQEKMNLDETFWEENLGNYAFGSSFVSREELDSFALLEQPSYLEQLQTVVGEWEENAQVFSYLSDSLTLQRATVDGFFHSFRDNLRLRSLETALGYSHILTDMSRVFWPREEGDRWELLADDFSRNTSTYWSPFSAFEATVVTESDNRIRNFLALDYNHSRQDNRIFLEVESPGETAWFLLRTHDEDIIEIEGGTYEKVEEDAYLITTTASEVTIFLESPADRQITP